MSSAVTQLLDLLAARFAVMTVANGYSIEPVQIERTPFVPSDFFDDLPALHYWATGVAVERAMHGYESREASVIVAAYTKDRDTPFITLASAVGDDVDMIMQRRPASPKTTDEADGSLYNSVDEIMGEIFTDSIDYVVGEGQAPYCGAVVNLRIRYRVLTGCPSVLIPM